MIENGILPKCGCEEGLSADVTFEQIAEEVRAQVIVSPGKKTVVGRINSKCKGLEAQVGLAQKGLDDCPGDLGKKRIEKDTLDRGTETCLY